MFLLRKSQRHKKVVTFEMPVASDAGEKYSISCLWREILDGSFNSLIVSSVFKEKEASLVIGSANGQIKVYKAVYIKDQIVGFEKFGRIYETKSGPIQSLRAYDVTKFSSNDILVGDSNGLFTVITNGQILNRRSLCESKIADIVIDTDAVGNMSIVIGSACGSLLAVSPYDTLWRCRLNSSSKEQIQDMENRLSITTLHQLRIQTSSVDCSYIIVADSEKNIHLFQNGKQVLTLPVPSVVISMCSGYFICEDSKDVSIKNTSQVKGQRYNVDKQVALATTTGAIFILSNLNIIPYHTLSFPLTQIKTLPAMGTYYYDSLLCVGRFDKLCILQNTLLVTSYKTTDWIHTFDIIDDDRLNDSPLIVLGCLDCSISLVRVQANR